MTDFYGFALQGIDGSPDMLGALRGKVTLVVNVASKCGYTRQYAGLEKIHQELKAEDFTVVGIPCNQFGAQEPGSASEIQTFCEVNYGVTFPLAAKTDVNGPGRHPLYGWLTGDQGGFPGPIAWNFEKFLIDRDGRIVRRYPSGTAPQDPGLLQDLTDLLHPATG